MKKSKIAIIVSIITIILSGIFILGAFAADTGLSVTAIHAINTYEGSAIKWKGCDAAEKYIIYRAEEDGEFTKLTELPKEADYYEDTSVVSGKSYRYKAVPAKALIEGTCKKEASVTYLASPTGISVSNSLGGIRIKWNKTKGADSYTIYRKLHGETSWSHAGFVKNTTSFVDKNVKHFDEYIYTVRAKSEKTASSHYNENGVAGVFIQAPKLKKVSNTADGIRLTWGRVSSAESYIVYRRTAGASWTRLVQLNGKYSSYTDTTVEPRKGYAYTVRAVAEDNISSFNVGLSYRFIPVVKVTSVKNQSEGLLVTWQKSAHATGYKLYRKTAADSSWKRIATVNGRSTVKYTDKKVASSKQYIYTVIAINGKSQSTFDNTGKSCTFVAPPEKVSFTVSGSKNIIKWEKVTGATNYYIYRRKESESEWKKLTRVGNTTSYTDSSASSSVVYYYCVRAGINSKFFSGYSDEVKSSRINPSKKMVAITYDDGPSDSTTQRILSVLEKYNAKATFFVLGSRVDSYSASVIRAHKLGCQFGNHTYSHINLPSYSESSIRNEIARTDAVVKKYTGVTPKIARAPGGSTSQKALSAVGKPFVHWSVDTRDWEHRNASKTVSIIKNNVRDGSIILMHDIYPATASASETIIPWLIDQGYQLVTVSELMEYRGINMRSGNVYYNGYKK